MDWKEIITSYADSKDMSMYELSKKTGIPQSVFSKILNGKVKKPNGKNRDILEQYFLKNNRESIISEPMTNYEIKSDVKPLNFDEEIEIFTNKNGVNFFLYPDDAIKIEVPIIPFEAYASSQIECYFDENYMNKEFYKTQFNVDKIGKGVYLGFKTKNESMNGGGINDTPGGADVLGREIGRQHWLSLHKNDYGFILMTKSAICHKDITHYNNETGKFTLSSRNPSEEDFEISINDVYRIFNVIKRTF